MKQRIITGALLVLLLVIMLVLPGWCMALATLVCTGFAVWEEYHALQTAGHRVVSWPTWVFLAASVPVTLAFGPKAMVPLLALTLVVIVTVILSGRSRSCRI